MEKKTVILQSVIFTYKSINASTDSSVNRGNNNV